MSVPFGSPPPPPSSSGGVIGGIRDLLGDVTEYVSARWSLFTLEAKEATGHVSRLILAVIVTLIGVAVGYVALWATILIFIAQQWCDDNYLFPVAGMAAFHLLAAGGAVWWLLKRGLGQTLFTATRREFKEDHQWLNRQRP